MKLLKTTFSGISCLLLSNKRPLLCIAPLRQQNIKEQDWKYISFMIFLCYSQTIRRHSAMGRDLFNVANVVENIGLKFRFHREFSIHLFHAMNRNYLCRKNVLNKIQIDAEHKIQW